MPQNKIKVLLVEDSITVLGLLKHILNEDSHFQVIGCVSNGKMAIEFVDRNKPDVISMDINMPVMDGLEATRQIMYYNPVPIVIVSSQYETSNVSLSFNILKAGALTILPTPFGPGNPQYLQMARDYRNTLKLMSGIKVTAQRKKPVSLVREEKPVYSRSNHFNIAGTKPEMIAIGASAGGPMAIQSILNKIPSNIPVPIMIVQHIDSNFAEGYCEWLNTTSLIPVNIARDGEKLKPGNAYLPPGDTHLGFHDKGIAKVTKDPPDRNLRPAVSYLFNSLAKTYGNHAIAILLSGMGQDGANELKMLHTIGSLTIAQDEGSSLVHGMPGEAIRIGGASLILSPENIVNELIKIYNL
jgi:two-component system chemotaxis response regulator CheB